MDSSDDLINPFNIGNPHEIKISYLAKKILKLTNSKSKIIYKNLPIGDPVRRKPDINLAMDTLKWKPKIEINEGLIQTINYFKNIL